MGREAPRRVNPSPLTSEFPSREVAQLARVSLGQLQWWDERGIISPGRRGRRRAYLPTDVIEILVIAELRRKGMSLQSVWRVLRLLRREMDEWPARVLGEEDLHLLTDGKSVHLENEPAAIIDRLKTARRPMLVISVGDQVKRLGDFEKKRRARESARRQQPQAVQDQLPLFS